MGKIIIDQYIFCETYESAKKICKAFENFKFKFFSLGSNKSVYAKRYIRKNLQSKYYPYRVIIRYPIEFDGEFSEYGFLDRRTMNKYPELIEKISVVDVYSRIDILHEYRCLEDEYCRDIFYYNNFDRFFNDELKSCMNKIYTACVIAFANVCRTDYFSVYYNENNIDYERGYFAHDSYDNFRPDECFKGADTTPISMTTVWNWMRKYHKYKKDQLHSHARPLTALTYALNRYNFERTFYSVVGLESVYTKSEKGVRKQLKSAITKVFPNVPETDIDLVYDVRSDFSHGDIVFPDYYENSKKTQHWSDSTDAAKKSTVLLIMTVRELIRNDAIKILVDEKNNVIFKKHQVGF